MSKNSKIVSLYNKIPNQVKSSIVILIASFATSAISFLTTPIFTRLMSVEEYGLVVQYNTVLEVISVIATLSLSAGVYQVAMNEFKNDRDSFTFSAMLLSNFTTIFVFVAVWGFYQQFEILFKIPFDLFVCMFCYVLFYPAMLMWMARQRYEYNYKGVAAVSIVTVLLSSGAGILAVSVFEDVNLGAVKIWATSIVQILCALIVYYIIAKKSSWKPKIYYIKYAFFFNVPLLIHYLAQYVLRASDKMMITSICGERATGLYGLGATVASIALLAWSAMAASLSPYMYANISLKKYDKVNKAVIVVLGLFGLCCLLVALIGPEIVYILGSQKYMENIQLIPPIAASSLLSGVYGIYSSIAFYYHKRISTSVMTIIAALINIGLNYIFIPRYGYIAAAYTTEISYLIYTILHYFNYRRISQYEDIFNDKYIWWITIITTLCCILSGLAYGYWMIRYGIIIAVIVLMVFFRKTIINNIPFV
ncbi:MAG: oligosaccharide flippase family protein [Clostridia bacterium]|nr:oligosaccharide flippase family protein [Clostridia bacterium]